MEYMYECKHKNLMLILREGHGETPYYVKLCMGTETLLREYFTLKKEETLEHAKIKAVKIVDRYLKKQLDMWQSITNMYHEMTPEAAEEKDDTTNSKTFNFEFATQVTVNAPNITEGIRIFHEQFPGVQKEAIKDITCEESPVASTHSDETFERIYYETGCPYGYIGCISDPMMEIAEGCAHQSDMPPDKYVMCDFPEPDDDDCDLYDDECK